MARKRVSENPVVVSTGAGASPARRSSTTTRRTARTLPPAETTVEPAAKSTAEPENAVPSYQQVAALAYSYWEARGYQGGSPEQDWFRAEQELLSKRAS